MHFPPISSFLPENDPAHANWKSLFPFPSQPSRPSAPTVQSTTIALDKLFQYMYPIDPRMNDRIVIGVYTSNARTAPKKELKPIYDMAGLPLCCHSCGAPIPEIIAHDKFGRPQPTGLYSLIGDHQPPTVLYDLLSRTGGTTVSPVGKLGQAAYMIQNGEPSLTLYEFKVNNVLFQTNSYGLAVSLSHQEPRAVAYGRSNQFLYPHCQRCSDAQGRLLW